MSTRNWLTRSIWTLRTLHRRYYPILGRVYKSTLTNGKQAKPLVFDNRGPSLQDFLLEAQLKKNNIEHVTAEHVPYLEQPSVSIGAGSKYYVEVYGCQVSSKEYPCILIIHDEC
jgi:hypothetical protein